MPITKLFAVTHPYVDPPPTGEPVPIAGQWTGRMIYDRRSTGECHDADVSLNVLEYSHIASPEYGWKVHSITVIRDTGGVSTAPNLSIYILNTGFGDGWMQVFLITVDVNLQFNAQGSAQGYWNYPKSDCYGTWSFTKD